MIIDVADFEKIAEGNDSHVYRDGRTVYKRFFRLTLQELDRYVDLVNRSLPVIEDVDYSPCISINGDPYNIRFRGTPILDLSMDIHGCPVTLAPYIAEPNLDKLSQKPEKYIPFARSLPLENEESAFLSMLNKLFYEEMPTRTLDEFLYHVDILSRILDQRLHTFGIYIGKYNAKIAPDIRDGRITIVITDVSVYIDRLCYEKQTIHHRRGAGREG